MSMFKQKTKKKKKVNKTSTLDKTHNDIISKFEKEKKSKKRLLKKIEILEKKLTGINNKDYLNFTSNDIRQKANLKEEIENLKNKINKIENNKEEVEYFYNTIDYLIPYYDIIENKVEKNKKTVNISDFFSKNNKPQKSLFSEKKNNNRATIYNNYLHILENKNIKKNNFKVKKCINPECKDNELTLHLQDGIFVCTECGYSIPTIMDSDKPSYKEPTLDNTAYAYKRINHFNEWLSQFQGKESTDIDNEIYDKILNELYKARIKDFTTVTIEQMRKILKKLGLNKYYEHTPHIITKISGVPAPTMNREIEEKLRQMFKEVQEPFILYCPPKRKNFLSYSYTLHKFCELLELDEFLKCFPLLKSREKLEEQDRLWKKICNYLQWEFIPSV